MAESLKRSNIKENHEKKNKKELKNLLWNVGVYFKLSLLKNGSQQYIKTMSWISGLSFPKCYNYLFPKIFLGYQSILVERLFENERSWN